MRLSSIVPAFVVLAAAGSAFGAIEEFNYTGSSLFGQNGGSTSGSIAWTGAWGDVGFGTSMGINPISIGAVSTETSTSAIAEFGLGSPSFDSRRGFTSTSGATDLYIWGLVRINHFNTANSYGGIGLFNGGGEFFLIGQTYQSANWGFATTIGGGSNGDTGVAIQSGVTALIVARLNQVTGTMSMWVNPNLAGPETAPNATAFVGLGATVDTVALRGGLANNGNNWQFDNLHVERGSPFNVPTPGAAALLGLGTLAAGRRRRA